MKIFGFMHGITNPQLIKRIHDKIPKSVDEMMRVTTAFLRGEVASSNHERKKSFLSWKQQEANQKQNFKKEGFQNQQRSERKQDRFALLTKTPKEIFALIKGKFKAPPTMTTPVKKISANKFCEFHGEVGHNTDECMHLRKQIEEMLKAGKLSHLVKEIKQNNGNEQPKSFSSNSEISFPPLGEDERTEGPMIIEAEIGGHCVHRMTNTTTGSNWRRRAFCFSFDEFCSSNAEDRGLGNCKGSFNSSRNAKDPGRWRSNYFEKQ
ncbi:hypothetical protein Tco_1150324 [Tanacetum coccineum]